MDPKASSIIALFLLVTPTFSQFKEISDEELFEIGSKALKEHASARGDQNKKEAFRSVFHGLSDAQKIRAIAYRILASDDDPKYAMSSSNSMVASYALGQDPALIQDWSQIGKMMKEEQSPRKFFLLSTLATTTRSADYNGFIAERAHMLFAVGRVAKDEGEYTKSYADNVSEYAYSAILSNLRSLKADFDPPAKDLPHEEQALILARWLREKWPGCENLEISGQLAPEEKRPDKKKQADETLLHSSAKTSKVYASATAEQAAKKNHWPWLIGGGMLLGIFFFLIRVFKTR
jgi:hypothetical protein